MADERRSQETSGIGGRRLVLRNDRGQALIEMGIVLILFITLIIGILEFGRAWMVANMITHAARDGARAAAVVSQADRDPDTGIINGSRISAIESQIGAQIATVLPGHGLNIAITQPTVSGINVVQVTIDGPVDYLFNLIGEHFTVMRTVTFRDEGR